MQSIFLDIGIIIIVAGLLAYIARMLKQPLIPAFILVGIILGPVLGVISDKSVVDALSEIGITFLLFSAGLELNIKKLKEIGKIATIGSIAHMVLIFIISFAAFQLIGFGSTASVYIALVLIFSSTLVVVKLLSDKKELDSLHGRIIVGMLLMQDIVAILVLSIINTMGKGMIGSIISMFFFGFLVLGAGLILAKTLLKGIFKFAARNDELLFIVALMIMFFFAVIYSQIGFSIAIGAFIAGILLGNLPYKFEIISQIKGLKEFFSVLFFVSIGLALMPVSFASISLPLIMMLIITLIILPLITMFVLALFGYKKRTAFMTSICLAQISEFSLIIIRLGYDKGHIGADVFSLTILSAIITIALTSYMVKYDEKLYSFIGRRLSWFERLSKKNNHNLSYFSEDEKHDTVLIGYDRTGYNILQKLKKMKRRTIIVDMNPDIIRNLIANKINCVYGDIGDADIISMLSLEKTKLVISTIPNHQDTALLIKRAREKKSASHNNRNCI